MVERIYQRTVTSVIPTAPAKRVLKDRDKKQKQEAEQRLKKKSEEPNEADAGVMPGDTDSTTSGRPLNPLKGKFIDLVL